MAVATAGLVLAAGAWSGAGRAVAATGVDLHLVPSVVDMSPGVGSGQYQLTLTVTNSGTTPATGVKVTYAIPAGITIVSASGGATPVGNRLDVAVGSVAAGASRSVDVVVRPSSGSVTGVFVVSSTEPDAVPGDNSITFTDSAGSTGGTTTLTQEAHFTTVHATTVNKSVDTTATRLITKRADGSVLSDQTFAVPFADASVQSAVAAASAQLISGGAASVTGPTLSSTTRTLTGTSSATLETSRTESALAVETIERVGADVFPYYPPDVFSSWSVDANGHITLVGPQPTYYRFVASGDTVLQTIAVVGFDVAQTTTVTSTYRNESVYVLTGVSATPTTVCREDCHEDRDDHDEHDDHGPSTTRPSSDDCKRTDDRSRGRSCPAVTTATVKKRR